MENEVKPKINIYEYTNYRSYLRDLYAHLKITRRNFSFRQFSRAAGFSSPNFLKLVIEGQRNLSAESIEKFATALKLGKEETQFFRNLVHLNQSKTLADKNHAAEALLKSRPYRALHPLKAAEFAYYASWYLVPVRELIDTHQFREDAEWIAGQLTPPITASEARKALETLTTLGLIERDTQGKLRQKNAVIAAPDGVVSASIAQFHREMIHKGAEAIDRFSPEEREISAVTMSLSDDGMRKAKQIIQRARQELLEIAGQDRAQNAVYQFGFQLFPLTRRHEKS